MESKKRMDGERSRDLLDAIEAVAVRTPSRTRSGSGLVGLAALPKLRRESPSERGSPVATTLRFRDEATLAKLVDFARRKNVEAKLGRDGVWWAVTMKFRNKTDRTTFLGQWGEESCDRRV